jgi:zinc and cadmium transporter
MQLVYNLLLFVITFAGGSIPLLVKGLNDNRMHYLLAFSGSFLLSITFLHLLPETFEELGGKAGFFLLVGFFVQLLIQRITHGIEHGHVHVHPHEHHIPLRSILVGLSLHAFMEGLPLGFNYRMEATEPSLYLAVAAHKLPEAMLVATLVAGNSNKLNSYLILFLFSAITPFAGILATMLGTNYHFVANMVMALIPIVAGAFIHIATTIFFESGTRQHMLTWQKIIAIILGVGIGLATLVLE